MLDSALRTPPDARLLSSTDTPALLVHDPEHSAVSRGNAEHWAPETGTRDLEVILRQLAERGCNELLVEAGAGVTGSFAQLGLWDEWIVYLAPTVLGRPTLPLADYAPLTLASAQRGWIAETQPFGEDIRITLRPRLDEGQT